MDRSLKNFLFLCSLIFSSVGYAQTCDSTDKREVIEKLECYCDPSGRSHVQLALEKLGSLTKSLGIEFPGDCSAAVTVSLLSYPGEKKVEAKIAKKLGELGYSIDDEKEIIKTASRNITFINLINSQTCTRSSGTLTIGPFTYGGKEKPAECKDLNAMDLKEQLRLSFIGMRMRAANILKMSLIDDQLERISQAEELVSEYPIPRIESCLKLSSSLNVVKQCLDLNVDDAKIDNCKSLLLSESASIKCLSKDAPKSAFQGCKSLLLGESATLSCLDKKPTLETAVACKTLLLSESANLSCLDRAPSPSHAKACKSLFLSEEGTMACLNMDVDPKVISSCKSLTLSEASTFTCLGLAPSPSRAGGCKSLFLSEKGTLTCLSIEVDSTIVPACKSLNSSEAGSLACLQSKASAQKIIECGQKFLSEAQTLECLVK